MKVAIIVPSNLINAPYYFLYENLLQDLHDIDIDLIMWNRLLKDETCLANIVSFKCKDKVSSRNPFKLIKYIRFSRFVKKMIEKNKYDRIIFLGSNGGVMALLSNYLKKKHKDKYWLDIRDYTFENLKIYYKMMEKSINNSYHTVLSSAKYKQFLPEYPYSIVHNIDKININQSLQKRKNLILNEKIRISYIGLNGYFNFQKPFINMFANDERFILQFYGLNSEILQKYCEENGIYNTDFYGKFEIEKTGDFYQKTDIINNVYGNDQVALTTALSNKLYYSLGLGLPILVCKNTYMEEVSKEAGNGFAIDFESTSAPDDLYNWYNNIFLKSDNQCQEVYQRMVEENEFFKKKFNEYMLYGDKQ